MGPYNRADDRPRLHDVLGGSKVRSRRGPRRPRPVPNHLKGSRFWGHFGDQMSRKLLWRWSCRWDLNPWSPHYQCGALPLSYGSRPITEGRTRPAEPPAANNPLLRANIPADCCASALAWQRASPVMHEAVDRAGKSGDDDFGLTPPAATAVALDVPDNDETDDRTQRPTPPHGKAGQERHPEVDPAEPRGDVHRHRDDAQVTRAKNDGPDWARATRVGRAAHGRLISPTRTGFTLSDFLNRRRRTPTTAAPCNDALTCLAPI